MIYLSYKGKPVPEKEELASKYFTPEEIQKGAEYMRRGFGIGVLQKAVDLLFPFVFFFTGFSAALSGSLKGISFGLASAQVVFFVIIYYFLSFVVNLPFRFYFNYILEHKFGFSNLTKKDWLIYNLKQFTVSLVFMIIIVPVAYYVFRHWNYTVWIWLLPVVMLVFDLFLTFIYPYLILPIFYKKSNFEDEKYAKPIREVAEKSGVHVKKIFMINESRYSKHTNAFFTGFGPEKSIYIFDTLVKSNSPEQVASVVAHEIGHWKHHHVLKGIALGFAGSFLMTALVYLTYNFSGLVNTNFTSISDISDIAGLPFIMIILTVYSFFLAPIENIISRKFEVTADTYEINMAGHPEIYIQSMVQLSKDNKSFLYPHPLVVFWFASHPPILERVKMGEDFKNTKS
ncbi:MAG: M48 family metallopeptidase [Candidatus Firestonebacteria bacterium]